MWLNDPAVREALHAAPKSMTGPWQLCSSRIHYRSDGGSMLPVHNDLVRKHGECGRDDKAAAQDTGHSTYTAAVHSAQLHSTRISMHHSLRLLSCCRSEGAYLLWRP
jgi:hypothetical protein